MSSSFPTAPAFGQPAADAAPTEVLAPAAPPDALTSTYQVPRVDLLPPEVLARRRFRATQRRSAVVLAAVAAALAGGYVLAVLDAGDAADELATAQARTAELTAEQARYARVPQVYGQVDAAQVALRTAMAADVRWYAHLGDLAASAPEGLWLTSITASVTPAATPGAVPGTVVDPLAAAGAAPSLGTLRINGTVREEQQVAAWLDALDATPGLTGATTSGITRTAVGDQPVMTFESSATITADALSRRFEQGTN
jgi:Tfp pilus assembly protein PilN